MNAKEKVDWFNEVDPLHTWSVDDDVFCLHCDGVFKAQDVARDRDGLAECPVCHDGSPLDFSDKPWWREDLVHQEVDKAGYELINTWIGKPITAIAGKPGTLPERTRIENN